MRSPGVGVLVGVLAPIGRPFAIGLAFERLQAWRGPRDGR
jgi:hypothetical protein